MAGKVTPWWVRGDINGFFGLFTNSLTNVMTAIGLLAFALRMPDHLVYGRVVPGLVLSIGLGNLYLAWMARRLSIKEGREDVTAMPYGVSVPHYFIVSFAVMLPVYTATKDWVIAWSAGVAWNFIHAIIEIAGAFIGGFIRRVTPRAAMLGTLAGVALTFIAMTPAFRVWEAPQIGLLSLAIVLIGWFARKSFPAQIPAGLMAIICGTLIGWLTGYMRPEGVAEALASFRLSYPIFGIQPIIEGMKLMGPYIASAIPLAIYAFMESMNNVESAEAGGDKYSTVEAMLVPGIGTLIGSLLGSPFPLLIYIGHPGWKSVGARVGYSVATGVGIIAIGLLGLLPLLLAFIPLVAILPILLYIGLVIGSQSFEATPRRHAAGVVIALVPWIANFVQNQVDNALSAAGTSVAELGYEALDAAGVVYKGMSILGAGPILVGMILGAIAVFIIDRRFKEAAGYALFGAVCSFFGFIHAPELGIGAALTPAIGYVLMAAICYVMAWYKPEENVIPADAGEPETA